MAIRLSQVERAYFVRKLGGTQAPTKPLNQIKREYYAKTIGAGTATSSFNELELKWMITVITDAALTPTAGLYRGDLWMQMVLAIGGVPAKNIDQNKILFYSTAP